LITVPSPNQPPGGRPVNVIGIPCSLSLLVLSKPSMTPNQYVTGRPTRHSNSPGSTFTTFRSASARSFSIASRLCSQGMSARSSVSGARARSRSWAAGDGVDIARLSARDVSSRPRSLA